MSTAAKVITLISSLVMIAVFFFPIWKIRLIAPQYPEGLEMKIWANKLTGNVDIINGLNHYIGMKTLHAEDFIEFSILPYIIIGYAMLGVLIFFLNRKIAFRLHVLLFIIIANVSLVDFYIWEYNYGHDLDPSAPIQVPGMSYQPPLIGHKQLLNFSAFSFPDVGGFLFAACGSLLVGTALIELINERKKKKHAAQLAFLIPMLLIACSGCSQSPSPIQYNADECAHCRMTIINPRFAAEIITGKGRVYKFDDVQCLVNFQEELITRGTEIKNVYINNFCSTHDFISAGDGIFLMSAAFKSPMSGNTALVAGEDSAAVIQQKFNARRVTWDQVKKGQ